MSHDTSAAGIAAELGKIKFKCYRDSLDRIGKLVFIRHGEKLDEDKYGKTSFLANAGRYRAENLVKVFGKGKDALLTPDVIYAMKQGKHTDNSNRPYLTVLPLASELGMFPNTEDRTEEPKEHIFDNTIHKRKARHPGMQSRFLAWLQDLVKDLVDRAENGEYDDKTLLFCWEHKNIPYIVARLGLHNEQLFWGATPDSEADERTNYSAIWVFTPRERTLQVFKQFEVTQDLGASNASGAPAFTLTEPSGGYKALARTLQLTPVDKDDKDKDDRDEEDEED